jgi:hypothetical protein
MKKYWNDINWDYKKKIYIYEFLVEEELLSKEISKDVSKT